MTSPAEAEIVVGGPRTPCGWGGINTGAFFQPVCPGAAVSSQPVLGRVIRRADTGSHTWKPLITVGDITIVEHFVK